MFCLISNANFCFLKHLTDPTGVIVKRSHTISLLNLRPGTPSATSASLLQGGIVNGPPTSLSCEGTDPAASEQPSVSEVFGSEGPQEALRRALGLLFMLVQTHSDASSGRPCTQSKLHKWPAGLIHCQDSKTGG